MSKKIDFVDIPIDWDGKRYYVTGSYEPDEQIFNNIDIISVKMGWDKTILLDEESFATIYDALADEINRLFSVGGNITY